LIYFAIHKLYKNNNIMRLKGTIWFFVILFVLASVFSLSFTLCTRRVENKAQDYAYSEETYRLAEKLANGDSIKK